MMMKHLLKVSSMFSDHMVIQRNKPVHVRGVSSPGKTISVSLQDKKKNVIAGSNGEWFAAFPALPAGGPFSITVSDGESTIVLKDILAGDVWVCSGQSNMEMPLKDSKDAEKEISQAEFPLIRHCRIPQLASDVPVPEIECKWETCTPETSGQFTAVGYFFARHVHLEAGIPIGLLNSSWGGSEIEPWIPSDVFKDRRFKILLDRQNDALAKNNLKRHALSTHCNAMVHALASFPIKGFLWYQGESNACWAESYAKLFPAMIKSWRHAWHDGKLPFYFVQLAGFGTEKNIQENISWPELREAQAETLRLKNTGMAVAIDVGEADNIHPRNKQEVGRRLALLALSNTYNAELHSKSKEVFKQPIDRRVKTRHTFNKITISMIAKQYKVKCPCMSPSYARHRIAKSAVEIFFKDVGKGLCGGNGGKASGFSIAGKDRVFVDAEARIEKKNVVRVSSSLVPKPFAVRYAWTGCPDCNLMNSAGLPAVPFRTDRWPLATKGRMWPD